MIRKFVGAVTASLAALAGLWLMVAPFALGTQAETGDWTDTTRSEFFTGLGVAVVGAAGTIAFALAIHADLVARGLVEVKRREPEPSPEPVPAAAPQTSSAELATLLAPLVEALREDLNNNPRPNGKGSPVGVEENR
ncbi:hypothetical protein E1267_00245 [Nonomuraea longispora]|uniref:Uncharacterized protein n=1 Tax=Nonomuraea longispora TaxID=1848320 RepID=A0A4V2XLR8_9ACTN|nr:hypothetical protein [Nonomuraea longispora]TDC11416.1 hypothetical protein E1267_00245 [Nonomuraea longispora]